MSCYILLSSFFLSKPSANGICAKNIANELLKNGHRVHVICFQQEDCDPEIFLNGLVIHRIDKPKETTGNVSLNNRIKDLRSCLAPPINNKTVCDYYKTANYIISRENVDCVIAMYFPLESVLAVEKIKKAHQDIKTVIYELDSVVDGISFKDRLRALKARSYERWNIKRYRKVDRIVVMESHKNYWDKTFGMEFGRKVNYADIPTLVNRCSCNIKNHSGDISFIYAGLLDRNYRSPSYLLECVLALKKLLKIRIDFYSKGNCLDLIESTSKQFNCVFSHGYVSEKTLDAAILDADVLVNIGNKYSHSVPSKLITYISYCKPIIHFSPNEDDVCLEYLNKYPQSLIVNENDDVDYNVARIVDFINSLNNAKISFEEIQSVFEKNTPGYSVNILKSLDV